MSLMGATSGYCAGGLPEVPSIMLSPPQEASGWFFSLFSGSGKPVFLILEDD